MRRFLRFAHTVEKTISVAPALNIPSEQAKLSFEKGLDYYNSSHLDKAIESFKQSIAHEPTSDTFYNLGNCYFELQDYNNALDAWKDSLIQPRSDAHVNIANVKALVLKDYKAALEHYEKALEMEPKDGQIAYNFALVLDMTGDYQRAIDMFKKAKENGIQVDKPLRNTMAKFIAASTNQPSQ